MVGQGVLRACLDDPEVETILAVGRSSTGIQHVKLREIIKPDMLDLSPLEGRLTGYDACFFCLGVSSLGMTEDAYKKVTLDCIENPLVPAVVCGFEAPLPCTAINDSAACNHDRDDRACND
jgi:hypothetical protein